MQRLIRGWVWVFVVGLTLGSHVQTAWAIKPFFEAWSKKYVKADSTDPAEKAFAEQVEKQGCNVCHQGKTKKEHNAYGKSLKKLIHKKDKDDLDKINKAFETVEAEHSVPDDPKSLTFAELFKKHELPAEIKK